MKVTLRLIFILNLVDAILTAIWINYGLAAEANPIMDYTLSFGLIPFITIKVGVAGVAIIILWFLRKEFLAKIAAMFSFALLFLVMMYHLYGIHMASAY
jgi:hypothetical protein